METFGAWLFIIGLFLHPVIFITYLILDIKYKEYFIRDSLFDIAMWCIFFCWVFIAGGMLCQYIYFNMFGVSESREPIKGEFAEKLIEEAAKIREQKMKKDYISNEKFDEEVDKTFHNIIREDDI